ncbi:MAG: hypothetical protein ABFQ95_00990 [Pseudomonadota bacterium]
MKKLARFGNSYAIPIDKRVLKEAHLNENAKFNIQVLPGGGLLIQSVEEVDRKKMEDQQNKIYSKYKNLFKRLADS